MNHPNRHRSSRPRWQPTWLPAIVARIRSAFSAPAASGHSQPATLQSPVPNDLRVLVADDNPSNLAHARELLGCWGITPMVAADGAEAVSLACKRGFDLILMDLQMPVLDGLAATKRIRSFEVEQSSARTPVLAYTSHSVDERLLRHCGLDGLLEKPCDAQVLQACLLRWCASGSGPTPAAAEHRAIAGGP